MLALRLMNTGGMSDIGCKESVSSVCIRRKSWLRFISGRLHIQWY